MNNNIATNYDLVEQRIKNTASSREGMISSLKNLSQTIQNTTQWQGADAEKHKTALLDFCDKLTNCARWMEAAGNQAIAHSSRLKERALKDQNSAARFE